jgi:YebC/PmpR family DNA-binding regulatory protein
MQRLLRALAPLRCYALGAPLQRRFAGHSKWAKIARGKGANDVARGALFTKISKMISSSLRAGGADAGTNLRLAAALEAAKQNNVPKELVARALASKEGLAMEELVFEALGPARVALLITCNTDNPRRTTPAIKYILSKHEAALASTKVFASKGVVVVGGGGAGASAGAAAAAAPLPRMDEDAVLEAALGAGAEDVEVAEDGLSARVQCPREATSAVRAALLAAGLPVASVLLTRVPTAMVAVDPDSAAAGVLAELLGKLEEQEDVLSVLTNAEGGEEEEEEEAGGGA